ncbi:uncharacterized protein LOC100373025 [Saccoglossus kowalevskii]|uniref:Uncharacterized protein LOC100373025 n=1 Tax=Saccoglossus kowalevskii TaxID=10224 RepID=A0ABM0MBJ6_SACKO|nr:PREDICTED: uncharacterized protein LOC100373025 [Saccoglossus kowalevskii]
MAFVLDIVVDHLGWRWAYWITAVPGIIIAVVMVITVKEPPRKVHHSLCIFVLISMVISVLVLVTAVAQSLCSSFGAWIAGELVNNSSATQEDFLDSHSPFCSPLFIVLLITSALRCGGGYVFMYNIHNYFHRYYPGYPYEHFMTWIPVTMGIFGALLGGMLADKAAYYRGYIGRLYIFSISIFVSIPLSIGVLYLDPPWCFIVLIPNFAAIEMWGSVAMSAVVEQAPRGRQTLALAFYVFSINMFGGNLNIIVPFMKSVIELRYTLLVLYPGVYTLALIFCLLTIPLARIRMAHMQTLATDDERKPLLNEATESIN